MKRIIKRSTAIICALLLIDLLATTTFAHSGRTDSYGGHNDNKNKSGLGSYHYHCGGYPAHLHTKGFCPYRDIFPSYVTIESNKTELNPGEEFSITIYIKNNPGKSKINFNIRDIEQEFTLSLVSLDYSINIDQSLIDYVKELPGFEYKLN